MKSRPCKLGPVRLASKDLDGTGLKKPADAGSGRSNLNRTEQTRVEMLNRYRSQSFLKIKVVSAALLGIMAFMIAFVAAPQVKADNANDVAKGLQNNRYYVTDTVKADSVVKQKYPNIDSDVKNIVNRVKGK